MSIMICVSCENSTRKEAKTLNKIKYDYSKLRGKIREMYGAENNFARAMQISPSSLSRKLSNIAEWKGIEVYHACRLLSIAPEEAPLYFFTAKL
jgi:hypothetical protein